MEGPYVISMLHILIIIETIGYNMQFLFLSDCFFKNLSQKQAMWNQTWQELSIEGPLQNLLVPDDLTTLIAATGNSYFLSVDKNCSLLKA